MFAAWSNITTSPFGGLFFFALSSWWHHQMETFSALLAICAGNSPVSGEFPTQRPVTRSFDVFFDLRPNKRLSKQSWGWWSETPSSSLWHHRNVILVTWTSTCHRHNPYCFYFWLTKFSLQLISKLFLKMFCHVALACYYISTKYICMTYVCQIFWMTRFRSEIFSFMLQMLCFLTRDD